MTTFANLTDALLPAVLEASHVIMRYFHDGCAVEQKAGGSAVTAADREAEAILLKALAGIAPNLPVVAEEMSEHLAPSAPGEEFFLVDPLDGTREFLDGRSEFTINVGLIRQGTPVYGLIFSPAQDTLYVTLAGDTAVRAKVPAATTCLCEIAPAPLRVNTVRDGQPLAVTASRSHGAEELETWLNHIPVNSRTDAGSSLKFCQVAAGEADIYPRFGTTMEWDTAAGHAIVLAAGGAVTTRSGAPLTYGKYEDGFRNPHFIAWARLLPHLCR